MASSISMHRFRATVRLAASDSRRRSSRDRQGNVTTAGPPEKIPRIPEPASGSSSAPQPAASAQGHSTGSVSSQRARRWTDRAATQGHREGGLDGAGRGPGRFGGCATGASGSRPGSATSSAGSGCGAPGCLACPVPDVGRAWRVRLQSAAHDRGGRRVTTQPRRRQRVTHSSTQALRASLLQATSSGASR
jgi:hypothetical protein